MAKPQHVRMTHTQTGGTWDAPLRYLDRARQMGYRVVGEPGPYDETNVDALKAEIDSRNADRPEDQQLSKAGNKPDLIATLIADDGRRA